MDILKHRLDLLASRLYRLRMDDLSTCHDQAEMITYWQPELKFDSCLKMQTTLWRYKGERLASGTEAVSRELLVPRSWWSDSATRSDRCDI